MTEANEIQPTPGPKPLQGVGGWLLLFVIGTFANVIFNLVILLQGGQQSMGANIMVYNPLQLALLAILALVTGVALLTMRNSNAVLIARVFLGFYLVSNILVAFFGLKAPSGYYIIDREGLIVKSIMQAVLVNLVWQLYFSRSKRVKATYPPATTTGLAAPAASAGNSLWGLFDRNTFGIGYFVGIAFFLAMMVSNLLWFLAQPILWSFPFQFPPASYFFVYRTPVLLLEALLLVVLLRVFRNDWLIATAMGLGTMILGFLSRLAFSGTAFGSMHVGGGFDLPLLLNGFMWSFFLVLGVAIALRTWGRKWWSMIIGVAAGGLASDLIGQLLYLLTRENFRFDFTTIPMDAIDGIVVGSILYLGLMLHLGEKESYLTGIRTDRVMDAPPELPELFLAAQRDAHIQTRKSS
jgi:hypothetical protein